MLMGNESMFISLFLCSIIISDLYNVFSCTWCTIATVHYSYYVFSIEHWITQFFPVEKNFFFCSSLLFSFHWVFLFFSHFLRLHFVLAFVLIFFSLRHQWDPICKTIKKCSGKRLFFPSTITTPANCEYEY